MSEQRLIDSRRGGFTLAETIVGMLVGTVALIALAGVMISSSQVQGLTLSRMELIAVGERQLDELRMIAAMRTADTMNLKVGGSLTANAASGGSVWHTQVTSARGRTYTVRWQVANGLNSTRNVTIRVISPDPRSSELGQMDFNALFLIE